MSRLRVLILSYFAFLATAASGQSATEGELIAKLMNSLQTKDSKSYLELFAGIDSLSGWIISHTDQTSRANQRMQAAQHNDGSRLDMDASIREEAEKGFNDFIKKGTALGIHWNQAVFVRYELEKLRRGRGLITEKIAPIRFLGYIFVRDMLTRKTFAFTVFDIMQVNGSWYGGELAHIFEADTKEKFQEKLAAYKKEMHLRELGIADTSEGGKKSYSFNPDDEDDRPSSMKEVLDRKFYKGKFDNEISVQLYVRYIKGQCPEIACSWEALFKFGDQDEYVRMSVSRTPDGKWLFQEDLGGMELVLDKEVFTGSYASSSDKTEYEVKLVETPIPTKKVESLDAQLEAAPEEE